MPGARAGGRRGGRDAPCVLNAANEVAVEAFLDGRAAVPRDPEVVERTLAQVTAPPARDLDDLVAVDAEARRVAGGMSRERRPLNLAVAIAGLVFLILIHEAGHFFVARSWGCGRGSSTSSSRRRSGRRTRGGIEYGIGAIPLGGYVKIPGMHRPAGKDLEMHLSRAVDEVPWLEAQVAAAAQTLEGDDLVDGTRGRGRTCARAVEHAELSERRAERRPQRASPTWTTGSPTTPTGARRSWKRDRRDRRRAADEPPLRDRAPRGRVHARRPGRRDARRRVGQPGHARGGHGPPARRRGRRR